jgi:Tol biopolymer transport system component
MRVYTMASDGSDVTPVTQDGPDARYPSYAPSGDRIIMSYYNHQPGSLGVWTIKPDGSDLTQVAPSPPTPGFYDEDPVYSPDGTRIAFMHIDEEWLDESCTCVFLYTMDGNGTDLNRVLTGGGTPDWGPAAQP